MSEARASARRVVIDLRDNADGREKLEVVEMLVDAAVKRIDLLWQSSAELRDGPRAAGTLEARLLLRRAVAALDGKRSAVTVAPTLDSATSNDEVRQAWH